MSKNNRIAVGVGMNFSVVPIDWVSNIELKETSILLKFNDSTFKLFKGKTFADSEMIDKILDNFEEYKIKDYAIKNKVR